MRNADIDALLVDDNCSLTSWRNVHAMAEGFEIRIRYDWADRKTMGLGTLSDRPSVDCIIPNK